MDNSTIILPLLLLILFVAAINSFPVGQLLAMNDSYLNGELWPVGSVEYRVMELEGNRRRLAPFQLCLPCRCCAAAKNPSCMTMPCCFGIDCHLPNKPFGLCAFVPKSCNCTSCAVA